MTMPSAEAGGPSTVVTGGTGYVGRFVVERLLAAGHRVTVMGRTPPAEGFFPAPVRFAGAELGTWDGAETVLSGVDFLVHAAFDHVPGRYRGGEGDDPEGFRRRNGEGSIALFNAAMRAGVRRAVFLSSRAVYGSGWPAGTLFDEAMEPRPDTLYGEVKRAVEAHLAAIGEPGGFCGTSLRVTGVYGPAGKGRAHKWEGLIRDYLEGRAVPSRAGTEVHGDDVAAAALLVLEGGAGSVCGKIFNVSDIAVDTHDILAIVRAATGSRHALPEPADKTSLNAMATERLRGLGWRPGGMALFEEAVRRLAGEVRV